MTHCSMRFGYGLDLCILKQGNMYFINIVFGSIFLVDLDTLCWINVEDCFTISTLFFYLVIVVFYCVEGHYLKNGHYVTLYIKKMQLLIKCLYYCDSFNILLTALEIQIVNTLEQGMCVIYINRTECVYYIKGDVYWSGLWV